MKITFDQEADAMYIEFDIIESIENKKIDDNTIVDMGRDCKILGIELLNVSKRMLKEALSDISFKNIVSA